MRTLALRAAHNHLDWAALDGDDRATATCHDFAHLPIPAGTRGEQLHWVRREVSELVARLGPDVAVLKGVEGRLLTTALVGRAEVEGVIQEALADRAIPTSVLKSATIRSKFGASTNAKLDAAVLEVPVIADTPQSRRECIVLAVATLATT